MRILILILLGLVLYQGYHGQELSEQLASAKSDVDTLTDEWRLAQQTAVTSTKQAATAKDATKAATLDREAAQSQLRKAQQELADAQHENESLTQRLKDSKNDADHFKAEAEAAKKQAADAKKASLADQHNTCPPPEVIPEETKPQEYAPAFHREDGEAFWKTDFDDTKAVAKKMGRLMFIGFGTLSCPHCDVFRDELSDQEVGRLAFKRFAPCYITVQDRKTFNLAEKFGVNKFQYPCAMLLNTETGDFVKWRPSKDKGELLRQIEDEAEHLK